jgi:hypothetical protein
MLDTLADLAGDPGFGVAEAGIPQPVNMTSLEATVSTSSVSLKVCGLAGRKVQRYRHKLCPLQGHVNAWKLKFSTLRNGWPSRV